MIFDIPEKTVEGDMLEKLKNFNRCS